MRGVRELFDLTGRVALVTGGGRGLGEQIARGLAQAGAAVALGSRKREACAEVAAELAAEYGARTLALRLDVSSEDEVRAAFDQAEAKLGPVDLLVNNSGTSWGAPAARGPAAPARSAPCRSPARPPRTAAAPPTPRAPAAASPPGRPA